MNLPWVDDIIAGLVELYKTRDVYDLYKQLNINIVKLNQNNVLLKNGEAMYQRSFFNDEVVFIKENLEYHYEKFILAHELGHALLHTQTLQAAYNSKLINKGKLEKQADYFALKLLNIEIDTIEYEGFTLEQIASSLYVSEESLSSL